ncbi:sensor histidine kinase [Rufibacter tibetensis]|uniref:sensor histidine kinase n=1 Tax=Rufibacter tibetensis TaxID=512763 RepID=UPI00078472B4|nr:HAMP domain-containing sensor histidine kinase [Rufibacter tibetensis]
MLLFQISSSVNAGTPAGSGPDGLVLVGELFVVTAYLLVAGVLFYLALKRDDRERRVVLALFGTIALMGGAVHLLEFWETASQGNFLLILRLVFGVAALIAAYLLFRAIPGLLAIPSEKQLKRTNIDLRAQIEEREKAEAALRETQQELEDRVQKRSAQAITANRELEREIENRKRAEKQLISKNYELIKKNADLDDFVYYASRDLKGPVLNVSGLVDAIREELPPNNPELTQLFTRLDDSVSSIHRKLNNLAEVSRIQKPVEEVDLKKLSFQAVLEQVQATLAQSIRESDAKIQADFSAAPEVFFSRDNLYSLLRNLLSNSIKYRDPQRTLQISLTTRLQDQYLVLEVKDNGMGMDLSQYGQHLFSLFRRFHDHVEGSGVGLYIIKRIMDNNRGKVEVQSVLGEGTTFLLYFVNHDQDTGKRV